MVKGLHENLVNIYLTAEQIRKKVKYLADRISKDYIHKDVTIVPILKGSVIFFSDLIRQLEIPCAIDFMSVSSYQGKKSRGVVKLLLDLKENPARKHILLVDEIIDSGYTLDYLLAYIRSQNPASIRTCVLLDKKSMRKKPVRINYKGFEVPNKFLIGYGLDYKEKYRNLPYIGYLSH